MQPRKHLLVIGAIALGGGLGALSRFAIGGWVTTWAGVAFPWATFSINVLGSLLLGLLLAVLPRPADAPALHGFLTVGFCGGFTTFSTFDYEILALLLAGTVLPAIIYAAISAGACLAGLSAGLWLGHARQRLRGPPDQELPPGSELSA
jgi:fluoride exporter